MAVMLPTLILTRLLFEEKLDGDEAFHLSRCLEWQVGSMNHHWQMFGPSKYCVIALLPHGWAFRLWLARWSVSMYTTFSVRYILQAWWRSDFGRETAVSWGFIRTICGSGRRRWKDMISICSSKGILISKSGSANATLLSATWDRAIHSWRPPSTTLCGLKHMSLCCTAQVEAYNYSS